MRQRKPKDLETAFLSTEDLAVELEALAANVRSRSGRAAFALSLRFYDPSSLADTKLVGITFKSRT